VTLFSEKDPVHAAAKAMGPEIAAFWRRENKKADSLPELLDDIPSNAHREKIINPAGIETGIMVYSPPMERAETTEAVL
jgi:hypothetical protein